MFLFSANLLETLTFENVRKAQQAEDDLFKNAIKAFAQQDKVWPKP